MALSTDKQSTTRREELLELAESWASMTKDLSIYPESNQRIRHGLEGFLSGLRQALGDASHLEITIHLEKIRAQSEEIPFAPHSTLPWLRTRLDPHGFAGLSFSKDLEFEDLLRYSKDLARPKFGKEIAAPAPVEGIKPILRVFGAAHSGMEADPVHFLENPLIAEICEASDEVRRKVEMLRSAIDEMQLEERQEITAETLVSILPYLPDSLEELEELEDCNGPRIHGKELSLLLSRLRHQDLLPQEKDGAWGHLLNRIGRNLFGMKTKVPAKPEPLSGSARGHARDDGISDDLPSFLEEFQALPEGEVELLGHAEPGFEEELMASYLELLLNDRDPKHRIKLGKQLVPMIQRPDPGLRVILRRFLDPKESPLWRIGELVDWLREVGMLSLARGCGVFDRQQAVDRFPVGFLAFLDTFDRDSPSDVDEIAEICSEIGARRFLEAKEMLLLTGGLEVHERKELLFRGCHLSFLPLIHIHLQEGGDKVRDRVVQHLRQMRLKSKEACVLQIMRDNDDVPMDYLLDLTARDEKGRYPETIRTRILHVLRDLLTSEDDGKHDLGTRTYAIQMIGEFRARESRGLLEELARQKGFLGMGNKDKRKLAKAASRALKVLEG